MNARIVGLLGFVLNEFGPLLVFYALLAAFGLKAAIAGVVAFIVLDAARRRLRGLGFTRIYLLSAGLTVVFGLIDLSVQTPFMLNYESVVTAIAVGCFFAAGARGERPMLMEIAERRQDKPFPVRADVIFFFRLLTLFWAAYFFLKAAAYLWLAQTFPVVRAAEVRSISGPVSLGVMFLISFQGRRLFDLLKRRHLLPTVK